MKRIACARVSTSAQHTDRQVADLWGPGSAVMTSKRTGESAARASRPEFDRALAALEEGDTLVVTTLDRLGRSTANMLSLAAELRGRGINLTVLNLGGGPWTPPTPWAGWPSP